jgi:hypothetical protein
VIAVTSGFMKKLSRGMIATENPWRFSSAATTGPTAAIGVRASASRSRASRSAPRASAKSCAICAALVKAIASTRPAPISDQLIGRLAVRGGEIDIGPNRVGLSSGIGEKIHQGRGRVGVELDRDAPAAERALRQCGDNPLAGRPLGAQAGLKTDLAQGPRGLWAAGNRPRLAERAAKTHRQPAPLGTADEAPQPLAGHQHKVIGRRVDKPPEPRQHRRRIGGVGDGDQRTAQRLRTLPLEHAAQPVELAMFEDPDAPPGERVFADRFSFRHGAECVCCDEDGAER